MIGAEDMLRCADEWELGLLLPEHECAHGWQPAYEGEPPADCECWPDGER